ncbi:MAG: cysteine desulfurase family protein [Thermoanaerobaculales bacterium]
MKMPIYMDYNATTPVDERVVEAMLPCLREQFGNAASSTHAYGWAAAKLVDRARASLASGIGAHPEEIVFTSGATEADNLAIKGVAWALAARGKHLVTCATEHKAVLDTCHALERQGFAVSFLSVDRDGRLDSTQVAATITPATVLVSVMLANNEIGTLHPIVEIAASCREHGVLFHCDATQAVGKLRVDVNELGVDLMSFTAHKIYGPKGVGALYVRRRRPRLHLVPLLDGGGHEQGMRSGTLNVAGVVGFARALELCLAELPGEAERLASLRDRLAQAITTQLDGVIRNGHPSACIPNTLNLSFSGVDGAALLAGLSEIAVTPGAACTSADPKPSHVLLALGRSRELINATLRFSLGRFSTPEDVEVAASAVVREVTRLRARAPLSART